VGFKGGRGGGGLDGRRAGSPIHCKRRGEGRGEGRRVRLACLLGHDEGKGERSVGGDKELTVSTKCWRHSWIVKAVFPTPPSPSTTSLYSTILPAMMGEG
jgi:hypothetical protein